MSTTTDSNDQEAFIPERDDPKVRRARIRKDPAFHRWHGVEPERGWDNPADIKEGKLYCQNMNGLCRRTNEDLPKIQELALYLRDLGICEETATGLIWSFNKPPFTKPRVELEVFEAYESAYNIPGQRSLAKFAGTDDWEAAEEDDDLSWLEGGKPVWPKPLYYDTKQNNSKIASEFIQHRPSKLIHASGEFYTLEGDKVWRTLDDEELAAEIHQTDPQLALDTPRIWAMVSALKLLCFAKAIPFDWIDKPFDAPAVNDLILFRNGILDFATSELLQHTGRYFATGVPDFDYDAAATCPTWEAKVAEWLHPSYVPTLQEFMGYALTPDTSLEVLLAMIGVTRSGKGTITATFQNLIGPNQHCARTLNDLAGDFGLQGTTDKRLIVIPDAHNAEKSRRAAVLERLKSITGNDTLSVNRKNLGIINVRIPAKLVVVANQIPKFLDESGALAARMLMLEFTTSFRGREDRELRAKLAAELPGIANWALAGLRRLRANGSRFTIGERGKAAANAATLAQSPALRFARDCLNVTGKPGDFEDIDTVHARYLEWADYAEHLSSRERRNREDFKADLLAALTTRGVTYTRKRVRPDDGWKHGEGQRVRGFTGVRLKPMDPAE